MLPDTDSSNVVEDASINFTSQQGEFSSAGKGDLVS